VNAFQVGDTVAVGSRTPRQRPMHEAHNFEEAAVDGDAEFRGAECAAMPAGGASAGSRTGVTTLLNTQASAAEIRAHVRVERAIGVSKVEQELAGSKTTTALANYRCARLRWGPPWCWCIYTYSHALTLCTCTHISLSRPRLLLQARYYQELRATAAHKGEQSHRGGAAARGRGG
jgi:hypothetical protein